MKIAIKVLIILLSVFLSQENLSANRPYFITTRYWQMSENQSIGKKIYLESILLVPSNLKNTVSKVFSIHFYKFYKL